VLTACVLKVLIVFFSLLARKLFTILTRIGHFMKEVWIAGLALPSIGDAFGF